MKIRPSFVGKALRQRKATIERYRAEGLDLIPGSGLLATVVPGAFDAWMIMLRDHGRLSLRDVLEPAIYYAEHGHPILANASNVIAGMAETFRQEWPTSAEVWLPNGNVPTAGSILRNPELAAFCKRLLGEAEAVRGREAQIECARRAFYDGFVAETIEDYLSHACVLDGTGERRMGVLSAQDMSDWRATYEHPTGVDYQDWQVWKCGPWTQGPVLLQSLRMLEGTGLAELEPNSADFVHLVTEALKLGFADRDSYYGDPNFSEIPLEHLLSKDYGTARRELIGNTASSLQRPGNIDGYQSWADAFLRRTQGKADLGIGLGGGEPTMAHLGNREGDTVHIDVVDQWGNMVSATPSGGWLQSNPVIPGLGVPLNSRAQMFWLDEGRPTSLIPKSRPRTTLSPSMARMPDGSRLAFGTPGGDQQDQWQLIFLLHMVHQSLNLQEAIEMPMFHTGHLQASFYPRQTDPAHLMIEPHVGEKTIKALKAMGHRVEVSAPWSVGRLTSAMCRTDGQLRAAATPRLMQAYAAGR